MTSEPLTDSALVRVTVASASRRVDLALPSGVPLAELVPELARRLGLLDAATVHGGYALVVPDGRQLGLGSSLGSHGIEDGAVLTVSSGVDEPITRRYDDVVEAMADIVEDAAPWRPEHGRQAALGAGTLFLALAAVALLRADATSWAAAMAGLVATALTGVAIGLSRGHRRRPAGRDRWASLVAAWLATAYAAVGGLVWAGHASGTQTAAPGVRLAAAGGVMLLAGLVLLVGLDVECRALLFPATTLGAILLTVGLVVHAAGWDAALVLTVALVGAVVASGAFPRLALAVTATDIGPLAIPDLCVEASAIDVVPVEAARVAADVRSAHRILLALSASVGVLAVVVAPFAVSLGVGGTLLGVAACAVVTLRARQHRRGAEALLGVVLGMLGLAATGVTVLLRQPSWCADLALVLVGAGALTLSCSQVPTARSAGPGRLADLVESAATLALLPLLVLASGAASRVLAAVTG